MELHLGAQARGCAAENLSLAFQGCDHGLRLLRVWPKFWWQVAERSRLLVRSVSSIPMRTLQGDTTASSADALKAILDADRLVVDTMTMPLNLAGGADGLARSPSVHAG
jgi:hypothetical protein